MGCGEWLIWEEILKFSEKIAARNWVRTRTSVEVVIFTVKKNQMRFQNTIKSVRGYQFSQVVAEKDD